MSELPPSHSITVDLEHRKLHFAVGGFRTFEGQQSGMPCFAIAAQIFDDLPRAEKWLRDKA